MPAESLEAKVNLSTYPVITNPRANEKVSLPVDERLGNDLNN
jgi:hypothetical protein